MIRFCPGAPAAPPFHTGSTALLGHYPAAKPADFTAITLGGLACPGLFEMWHDFALFRQLETHLPAGVGLAVESLGDCRRTAHLSQGQHLHFKLAAVVFHAY